jgi:glycosyltransferase involved in cell wall biosynthesis
MPHPPTSGGHKRTLRLIEAIARAGGVPHILTVDRGEPGAADELRARGWIVEVLDEAPQSLGSRIRQHIDRRPSPYLRTVAGRLREVASESVFVQFEHTQNAYYWDAIGRTKSVLSLHNVDSQMLASVMRGARGLARVRAANRALSMRSVERRAVPRADVVLTVSEHDRRHFEHRARRVLEVPNGIDEEFFDVPAALPDGEDVLFFGHLDYLPNELGVWRFVREGWPRLAASRPGARLLVAGKGMSTKLARMLDAEERIVSLGFVPDLVSLLERSRVVLVPLWQGGGTRFKVLEALASARPIVGTPQGVEEIGFVHARHGLLADRPAALADAAAKLLGDRELSRRLTLEGRALAERYRWTHVLEPVEALYREWLGVEGQAQGSTRS